jgi:hypothetical protein
MALCNPEASSRKLVSESENLRPIFLLSCFFGIHTSSLVFPLLFIKDKSSFIKYPIAPAILWASIYLLSYIHTAYPQTRGYVISQRLD